VLIDLREKKKEIKEKSVFDIWKDQNILTFWF
jgi:hypothetical protein